MDAKISEDTFVIRPAWLRFASQTRECPTRGKTLWQPPKKGTEDPDLLNSTLSLSLSFSQCVSHILVASCCNLYANAANVESLLGRLWFLQTSKALACSELVVFSSVRVRDRRPESCTRFEATTSGPRHRTADCPRPHREGRIDAASARPTWSPCSYR